VHLLHFLSPLMFTSLLSHFSHYPNVSSLYPEYFSIVKRPMDLLTVLSRLADYRHVEDFRDDIRLIWRNCMKANKKGSDIISWSGTMSKLFEDLFEVCVGQGEWK
jgi:Bromodomain